MQQAHDAEALSPKPMAAWLNPSGITPTEFKVLIAPKEAEQVTKGGIILADTTKDSEKYAATEGTIVAVSPLAFSYATKDEWQAAGTVPPKSGDRVIYAKYAGVRVKSKKDGKEYLLVNDKDICAHFED
jgi:co-chaperonin GroES (HSP10)